MLNKLCFYILGALTGMIAFHNFSKGAYEQELAECEARLDYWKQAAKTVGKSAEPMLASKAIGEKLFKTNCAACHGLKGQGAGCPKNSDASLELLKSKVLNGSYPKGYKPRRNTRSMPKFPFLKDNIEDIHEYLKGVNP